ncbi:hypothetical protein [Cyanobium sp. NS01]|uniref:hypothetical protein n=1 Tax=Cyanobium sp. NS01 TaxID=261284 RepID=UPI0016450950|nr:hypothetical protein [Cyanobium sp. NS01]
MNSNDPSKILLESTREQLSADLHGCDSLILSHEFLFQNPYAVNWLCLLANTIAEKIFVIGYCRRQSDFLASAYSQWFFRSPVRVREVNAIVNRLGFDPSVFTGLERQFIASIENNYDSARMLSGYSILDWNSSYNSITQATNDLNVTIRCGTLPNKEKDRPLIQDFCDKAELRLHAGIEYSSQERANRSFDPNVVEAINAAVGLGIEMMGPHESNDIISLISSLSREAGDQNISCDLNGILSDLASYTDWYYWPANQTLCNRYDLEQEYFKPRQSFSKQDVLDRLKLENHKRTTNMSVSIERYQLLSAMIIELCITLARVDRNAQAT